MNDYAHSPIGKLEIENKMPGTDPLTAAMLAGRGGGDGGLFGGGSNGLMSLLLGAFLFGGRGGLFGGAGAAGGDAVAAASITTSKDVSQQLNTFQSWAAANAQTLATQLCTSTADITSAVNALTPQMYQAFANQSATIAAQFSGTNDHVSSVERNVEAGFAATQLQFQTTSAAAALDNCKIAAASQLEAAKNTSAIILDSDKNATAIQAALTSGNYALAQQLAACCCENRLAIANQNSLIEKNTAGLQSQAAANYASLANQLNVQTCELKQAVHVDGEMTRALINANRQADLLAELADAKSALSNSQQTAAIAALLEKSKHHPHCGV